MSTSSSSIALVHPSHGREGGEGRSGLFWLIGGSIGLAAAYYWYENFIESQQSELQQNKHDNDTIIITRPPRIGRVEVCLSDIESILAATRGGADSVEICCARGEGGITPSIGLCEEAAHLLCSTKTAINVLVRPREGNFVYSAAEFDVIVRDVLALKRIGVDGIVVGFLDSNGKVDKTKLSIIRAISKGMILTFHRAFDVCSDTASALEDIIAAGCDRLLTSGCCSSAGTEEVRNNILKCYLTY
jgi:hypothetical protein